MKNNKKQVRKARLDGFVDKHSDKWKVAIALLVVNFFFSDFWELAQSYAAGIPMNHATIMTFVSVLIRAALFIILLICIAPSIKDFIDRFSK